jgi:hypothetical protein
MVAEFETPTALVAGAQAAYAAGYRKMDAYSPIPIEELHEALGFHRTKLPMIVLMGGIAGLLAGYGLEYWASTMAYPMNVGGRPFHSWPQFIPVAFETTILGAALAAVFGMLALNGCIEARDPKFALEETQRFLEGLKPRGVAEVAW